MMLTTWMVKTMLQVMVMPTESIMTRMEMVIMAMRRSRVLLQIEIQWKTHWRMGVWMPKETLLSIHSMEMMW